MYKHFCMYISLEKIPLQNSLVFLVLEMVKNLDWWGEPHMDMTVFLHIIYTVIHMYIWTWICFYALYMCIYTYCLYTHTHTHIVSCVCVCLHGSWTYLDIWICVSIYQIALPVWVRAWNLEVLTLETSLSLSSAGTKSRGRTETLLMSRYL